MPDKSKVNKTKKEQSTAEKLQNNVKLRLPIDYPWKVLGWLVDDLQSFLTDKELKCLNQVIRNRDFKRYKELSEAWSLQSIDYEGMHVATLRAKYQIGSLLKKFRFDTDVEMRKQNAIDKFFLAEAQCKEYNESGYKKLSWANDNWMVNINTYALSFIRKVLGDFPDDHEMTVRSRHGSGATLDTISGFTSSYEKFDAWPYDCTLLALPLAVERIKSDPRWLGALEDDYRTVHSVDKHAILDQEKFWSSVFSVVPGNKIGSVPKNADTERIVAKEPTLNVFLQLGVDGYIRRRLKRWGINLDDQSKNQELARRGSMSIDAYAYATLDMSAASDTISIGVVKALLPPAWFDYLNKLRSPVGDLGGETIVYEKFSSMGNGYTFALESLIFAAVVYAVEKEELGGYEPETCAIYGDDLIVPDLIAKQLVYALECCGFTINTEKSFLKGPIKESCGTDWFNGANVRPIFFSETPRNVTQLFTDFNRLRRQLWNYWSIKEEDSRVLKLLLKWVPESFKDMRGPISNEQFDSHLHTEFPVKAKFYHGTWHYSRLVVRQVEQKAPNFLFRKLMHDLSETAIASKSYEKPTVYKQAINAGSRFVNTRRDTFIYAISHSTSEWTEEYTLSQAKYKPVYLPVRGRSAAKLPI